MSSPSNLYAEKVFAEHPLNLWALDDTVDYISLLSETDREINNWTADNCIAIFQDNIAGVPFIGNHTTLITANAPEGVSSTCKVTSGSIINFLDLNSEMSTITISGYFNALSSYITGITIGYEYNDTLTGEVIRHEKFVSVSIYEKWFLMSETFDYPDQNVSLRLFIEVSYLNGGESHDHNVMVNGITLGQWSEEFNSISLGVMPEDLPSDIPLSGYKSIPAYPYGLSDSLGYYLSKDNRLLAKNTGMPMVYGASSVTALYPDPDGGPSLIIPGNGFLNNTAKYSDMTLEFWLRLDLDSSFQQRLVGPIGSSDGLYIRGPVFLLKIGDNYGTYFVHEWARPMLIAIRVSENQASLLINGEQVISIDIDMSLIDLPDKLDSDGKDQDWIGFYTYQNFTTVEIDCPAVYSYLVPAIVAKRKFVYGQGVEFPENINTAYSGTSMFIDYRFADYANNYNYPDIGKWQQGSIDNFSVTGNTMSIPNYKTPEVFSNFYSNDSFIEAQEAVQNDPGNNFFRLNPLENPTAKTSLYFDNLNFISGGTRGFYVVMRDLEPYNEDVALVTIYDKARSNYLQIRNTGQDIDYIIRYNSEPRVFTSIKKYYVGETYSIGMDFKRASNYFGGDVAAFLGQRGGLSMYVGNDNLLSLPSYDGNIYRVGFFNTRSSEVVSDNFAPNGIVWDADSGLVWDNEIFSEPQIDDLDAGAYSDYFASYVLDGGGPAAYATSSFLSVIPTYVLFLTKLFDTYRFDIQARSYWEDYIPLQYFAKYVEGKKNNKYYDLDFLQFNISYPSPSVFFETDTESGEWTYGELYTEYDTPVKRSYDSLDNQLFTGYSDYGDLQNRISKTYSYNTSSSLIKTYVSFQLLSSGANLPSSAFLNVIPAPKDGVVRPGTDWMTTKYEVVNNMIIYPPTNIGFDEIAIVTHIESVVPGIYELPIKIKSLQYCSQALSENSSNPIGTRFGVPLYPYKRSGVYYSFKDDNPFSIYKGSSPYLYLSRYSGIQPRGGNDPLVSRGLMMPMNQNKASEYRVIAAQMSIRYDEDFFPYAPVQILEIESKDRFIKVFMEAIHSRGKRAKIYAINGKTGAIEDGIAFFWNGNVVKNPVISIKEWGMLGISFASPLDVANTTGFIRFTGPLTYNNVSHYQSTNLQEVQEIATRPWYKVKSIGTTEFEWEFWKDFFLWNGVLIVSTSSFYGIDPSDIYKTYTGTNKVIINDERPLVFGSYKYEVTTNVGWQSQTVSPV